MAEQGAVFDEFVQGGLLDDANVQIQKAFFRQWDYNGKIPQPVLGLQLNLLDPEGKVHEEVLSAGELRFFVPSTDGKKALPVGTQTKLNINTNAVMFLIAMMNADTRGQLAAKIKTTDDISVIEGTWVHVIRKDQPKRIGISVLPGADGQDKAQRALSCDKVIAYAGEPVTGLAAAPVAPAVAPAAVAPVAPVTVAAPAAAAPAGAAADAAAGLLLQILIAEPGNAVKKQVIAGKVFAHPDGKAMAAADRNAVLSVIVKDEFLQSPLVASMGMKYDPATATVSMG